MRFSHQLLLIFVLNATLCAAQHNSHFSVDGAYGMIAGTVLDATGQVAEGARVCISAISGVPASGATDRIIECPITADKYGQFQFEHLKLGPYEVFAQDAGDQSFDPMGPKVTLTADRPYAHVALRLKPGGILLGSVTDAMSGKPVQQFQVQYVDLDRQGGGSTFGLQGKFRVVVPVATDLVVIVTAQGHKGWVYTDSDDQSRPVLRVAAGEQKQLDIELQPLSPGTVPAADSSPSSSH